MAAPDTDFHRIWECPSTSHLESARKTRHLEPRAALGVRLFPAFWIRGLIPLEWLEVPEPPDEA
eukprot:1377416-Lingulodinium_polyedra.AAC.1